MEARSSKGKARRCGAPPPNTSHQFPDLNPTPPTTFNVRPTFLPSSNQPRRRHQSTPSRLPLPSAAFRRDPHPAGKPLLLPPFPRSNALPPAPPGCSVSPSLVVVPLYYQLVPMRVPYAAGEHRWRSNQAGERASLRAAASRNGFFFFVFFSFWVGLGWVVHQRRRRVRCEPEFGIGFVSVQACARTGFVFFFFFGVSGITELGVVDRWISRWNSLLGTSTIAAGDPKQIVTYLSVLGEIDPSNQLPLLGYCISDIQSGFVHLSDLCILLYYQYQLVWKALS